MKTYLEAHIPCPNPTCNSSDAFTVYLDGGYCHSCETKYHNNKEQEQVEEFDDKEYTYEYLPYRGIDVDVCKKYDVLHKINSEGKPVAIGYPHPNGAIKQRKLGVPKNKAFSMVGDEDARKAPALFGRDKFSAGSAKVITITEGNDDAMAAYQMLERRFPVVSVRSSSTAKTDCIAEREYLNSFEKIYLCFDNDKQGNDAKAAVASLFDFNRVYDVHLDLKDANEYRIAGRNREFLNLWNNARRFIPEGIISNYSEIDQIIDEQGSKAIASYPFGQLEGMCDGIHEGELILLTAQEKIGKTEIIRACEYHLLKSTDYNIGIIHLEEPKKRIIQGLAGYELGLPVHLNDSPVNNDDIKKAFRVATGRDERVHIYSHFGSDDPDVILDRIRFLATACGCKFIFLDHLSMVVSGLREDDERRLLDYISTTLKMMCVNLGFTCFVVSHVNDDGKPRGSRNIAKVCNVRIDLQRDLMHPDPRERNITLLNVLANRTTGITGEGGKLYFDPMTFKVTEMTELQGKLV